MYNVNSATRRPKTKQVKDKFIRNLLTDKHTNQRNRLKLYLKNVIEKEKIEKPTYKAAFLNPPAPSPPPKKKSHF